MLSYSAMFSFLLAHCPSEISGGREGGRERERRRKRGRKRRRKGGEKKRGRKVGKVEGGREGGEREILLSANSLLKILIPLKASKELFSP